MSARSRLFVAVVSTVLVGYVAVGSVLGRVFGDSSYAQLSIFNEVVRIVLDAYVEPVDMQRTMAGARLGLTDALDGDSSYLDAAQYASFKQPPAGDADVGLELTRRYAFLAVVAARPGSPAEKAGVRAGDIIKTIDGKHSRNISPQIAQRMLAGGSGSTVKLTLLRAGVDPIDVSITRGKLSALTPTSDWAEPGTARIRLPEVSAHAAEQLRVQLEGLKKQNAQRVLLDLRGSAWGDPAEAARVAELVVKPGTVARLAGAKVPESMVAAEAGRQVWTGPLAVLVDRGTSGAAEIVAAAVLESTRGPVVGENTVGRTGVQKAIDLPEGGLVLTVATWRTGKGEPIHGKGVKPTVPVNVEREDDEDVTTAPKVDVILQKALEALKQPAEEKKAA